MAINTNNENVYKKYVCHGKNKVYNRKFKIIKGKKKIRVTYKEYSNILGSDNESIDSYNLDMKLKELKKDLFINSSIEEKENKSNIIDDKKNNFIRKDNLIRSRNHVFDLARCNDEYWKSFITLTFKENIQDINIAYDMFNKWLKSARRYLKRNNIEFYYLGVIEFQKRGAIHYHLLTNIECGSYILPLQESEKNKFNVMYWKYGFSSAFNIVKDVNNFFDIAKYMCKYMAKKNDDIRLKNHKRYYHSRNLKKPLELTYMDNDINFLQILNYLTDSCNYEIINSYHHTPKERFEQEYNLIEFESLNNNEINIFDIATANLDF
ncbi:MAG: hypothetical protein HFF37_04120 [Coprobacillus sp.]|nr:hypothetical protein [Coprobacillus sp.]